MSPNMNQRTQGVWLECETNADKYFIYHLVNFLLTFMF